MSTPGVRTVGPPEAEVRDEAPASCFFLRGRPLRDTVTTAGVDTVAVTVDVAAEQEEEEEEEEEEADVTTVGESSEQIPLLVTLELPSKSGGEEEDINEDEMAVGIGGDRGMLRMLPPPQLTVPFTTLPVEVNSDKCV